MEQSSAAQSPVLTRGKSYSIDESHLTAAEAGQAVYNVVTSKTPDVDRARTLMRLRPDLEWQHPVTRRTALIEAAGKSHRVLVQLLLDNGASRDARDKDGLSARDLAVKKDLLVMVCLLEGRDMTPSEAGREAAKAVARAGAALWTAIDSGDVDRVRVSLRRLPPMPPKGLSLINVPGNEEGWTPLVKAAHLGHDAIVGALLEAALEQRAGVYARVVALLEAGGRMSVDEADAYENARALWEAAGGGDATRVRTLLAAGADLEHRTSAELTTPLLQAARYGHEEVVSALIGARANTEARDGTAGRTAIDFASYGGFASVLVVLLRAGAFVEGGYPRGATPLIFAARRGHAACVTILAEHGARIEHKATDAQWTALIEAASAGANAAVKALLVAGAYVDGRGGKGETALYEAACAGHADVVTTLLKSGAVNRFDDWGAVPIPDPFAAAMREARRRGHTDVVALLDMHVLTEADFEREYGCSRKAFGQYKAWKQRTLHRMNGGA